MKNKATLFLALLAFAFGAAQAVPVSQSQAASAAAAWAKSGDALGARLGSSVDMSRLRTVAVHDDVVFHVVPFADGGVVVTSCDTEFEPIVAFSSNELDLSENSPVTDLLKKDAWLRSRIAGARSSATSSAGAGATSAAVSEAEAKWAALLSSEPVSSATATAGGAVSSAKPVSSVSDVRVKPLIKSKWSQQTAGGGVCFNYYTPDNAPCGCTATAAAQVMRYFTFPTAEMPSAEFVCGVSGTDKRLSTIGGVYDWANMKLDPMLSATETERKAIGHLTYDIGVALGSDYSSASTGAQPDAVAGMMRESFGYANAYTFWNGTTYANGKGGLHDLSLRKRVIYSNLDAKIPVQLAIYGYTAGHFGEIDHWAGHAVVADGYGFKSIDGAEVAFVHINMGWGGSDDMWYNIPDINTAETGAYYDSSATEYCYLGGATFNVFTEASGLEIFSGRVVDHNGAPVKGAKVSLKGGDSVLQTSTDEYGVYAFTVPGGTTYVVRATSEDETLIAEGNPVALAKSTGSDAYVIASSSSVGNSWGNDLVLAPPAARIGADVFPTLDKAFSAAKAISDGDEIPVIEILEKIALEKRFTVDFSCVVTSVAADPAETVVSRLAGASIVVAENGSLVLSNIAFASSDATAVEVAAGGKLTVGGGVDFGVAENAPAVKTADAAGLAVSGALAFGFSVDCAAAEGIGKVFGSLDGLSAEDAAVSAAKIVNFNDDTGEIRGAVEGAAAPFALKWAEMPVPFGECSCYYVDADGNTNTSARIDRLMLAFAADLEAGELEDGAEIVIRKSGKLSVPVVVGSDISIRGENDVKLTLADPASFTVTNGTLSVQGVGFEGFKGNSLFLVDGGELVLSNGVSIAGAVGTNTYSGAVAILKGEATLGPGIAIADCGFVGNGNGGGVYVGIGATLNFFGGSIVGCTAGGNGGGIYLNKNARLNLKGEIDISGNHKYNQSEPNNIYAAYGTSKIKVVGAVSGSAGVRYGTTSSAAAYNKDGASFAEIEEPLPGEELAMVARGAVSFRNDADPGLVASISGDRKSLVWGEDEGDGGIVPGDFVEYAFVRLTAPGEEPVYYWTVADAVGAVLKDGTTLEMLRSDVLGSEVAVTNAEVRLSSDVGVGRQSVSGGTIVISGSLALTNIVLSGESLFRLDGGLLMVEDVIADEIGCVGGSSADPMLFARVRCDLSYDSLTNSAANFRNSELGAYGVAITNASDTAMVWSTAIAADGSFTDASGAVWGCVGDIPDNVVEIEVNPGPIAFRSIVLDKTAGEWNLTLTNLVRGCWYKLYATNSLAGGFTVGEGICEPVTNFQAEADGEFIFKVEDAGGAMFWKAVAEPGVLSE